MASARLSHPDVSTELTLRSTLRLKREFVILRRAYLTDLLRIRSSGAFSLIIFLFLILYVLYMYTDCKIKSESFCHICFAFALYYFIPDIAIYEDDME